MIRNSRLVSTLVRFHRAAAMPRRWLIGTFGLAVLFAAIPAAAYPPAVPAQLILTVRESSGVARISEVVSTGIPIPRSLNLTSFAALTVVDGVATPVPAQFRTLARWNAGIADPTAPIQWLLVTFPASVGANASASYRVVTDGSAGPNPPPAVPLTMIQVGNQVTVNTGAAVFRFGGNAGVLFDEIRLADSTLVASGGGLTARVNGIDTVHPTLRGITIEQNGPLSAVIIVDGAYDLGTIGGGGLGSRRRYVFTAGSPTAIVRHAVAWEGDLCGGGVIFCDGAPNGVRIERVRDILIPTLGAPLSVQAVGAFAAPAVAASVALGQSAAVRQLLRPTRASALAFDVSVAGSSAAGIQADGGVLGAAGANGALVIALNHMHRYEPQALRVLADGSLAIDISDGNAWLSSRQGLFATLAVSALAPNPGRASLDRLVWAPLNHPLRAWPAPAWFAASRAVDEIAYGSLPANLSGYDPLVSGVLANTLAKVDEKGLAGLMTFGVYPRIWGSGIYSDELDCGDDPTPAETWDDAFWCATWTDYHSTIATAPAWSMRSGDPAWLDEIAAPGALRVLHTQILQCGPADGFFYCGQSPSGYGGYRADFNSSHGYFDNLMLYYWLTGDSTVVDTLTRGASTMRAYLCPGPPCSPNEPPTDVWAQLTGRVAMQWLQVFRFVGLTSPDASYLGDWRSGLGRAVTQYYVEASQAGRNYGFWTDEPVGAPGPHTTSQIWMISLYDMNVLHRLQVETNDAPLGNPAIAPSRVQAAWARTLTDFGSTVAPGGDGTAAGVWPNQIDFNWTGARLGGTLVSVTATPAEEWFLYDTGKATLTAALVRAGDQTGEAALTAMGRALTEFSIAAAQADGQPLGKFQGEFLGRLHAAVARLSEVAGGPRPVADGNFVAGTPMRGSRNGANIDVTWDPACGSSNYNLYRGSIGNFTAVTGGACAIGTTGTATGIAMPANSWWIIAGTSASEVSSFGRLTGGAERPLTSWSAACPAQTSQNTAASCP